MVPIDPCLLFLLTVMSSRFYKRGMRLDKGMVLGCPGHWAKFTPYERLRIEGCLEGVIVGIAVFVCVRVCVVVVQSWCSSEATQRQRGSSVIFSLT